MKPNWANGTIFTGDNLLVMRGMNNACVDLIYLDPPFCSNQSFQAPAVSHAAGAVFDDSWTLNEKRRAELALIQQGYPVLYAAIHAAYLIKGEPMQAYLTMMATRLLEMQRILKPTGAILLHCDDHADSYLRSILDCIFGEKNFLNQVVWQRSKGRASGQRFGRTHDLIYYYRNGDKTTWNHVYQERSPTEIKKEYLYDDRDGRGPWASNALFVNYLTQGESSQPWRGIDPSERHKCWRTPVRGNMCQYIIDNDLIPGWPNAYPSVHQRLEALDRANLIHWPHKPGGTPRLKFYLKASKGVAVCDVITGIPPASGKERVGYPTQKPLKLLSYLIEATTCPGDLVLDPFCGAATTCVAAASLSRQWTGIDISPKAAEIAKMRFEKEMGLFSQVHHQDASAIKRTDTA